MLILFFIELLLNRATGFESGQIEKLAVEINRPVAFNYAIPAPDV